MNDNLGPQHAAIVARDAAIVARERARPAIRTTDAKFYTGTGDPLPPQVRATKRAASPIANRWRFSDGAAIRTRDMLLSAEPTSRNPDMMGSTNWNGDPKPEGSFAAGASPEEVNDANKKYWDEMAESNMPDRPEAVAASDTQATLHKMQKANDSFWRGQTAHQRTPAKVWGKG
jgi:hypothetical protein